MSTTICPHCAGVIKLIPLSGSGGGPSMSGSWQAGKTFAFGAGKLPAGSAEYSRETPTGRVDTLEGGLRLPAGQAALTGAVALALGVVVALLRGGWQWWEPVVIGVVVFSLAWWLLLIQSRQLLSSKETVTADPGASDRAFSVEITLPPSEGKKMLFVNFPGCRPEHVRRFATAANGGRPSAESARLSRARFVAIRDESIKRGLVRWRDPDYHTLGLETSSMGKVVFQRLLDGVLD